MVNDKKRIINVILALAAVCLGTLCFIFRAEFEFPPKDTVDIDSPYILRDTASSRYILDKQRTRILVSNRRSNEIKYILPPSGQQPDCFYYADDFQVDENGFVYVKEGSWDGNRIAREAILVYDNKGNYLATYYDTEYTEIVNKHKVMLLSIKNGTIKFGVKEKNWVNVIDLDMKTREQKKVSFAFENAFDFVNDMTATEDGKIYLLDKSGRIFEIDPQGLKVSLVYTAKDDEFPNWIEPSFEKVLFADLYSDSVKELNPKTGNTITLFEHSGAVTVTRFPFWTLKSPVKNNTMFRNQILYLVALFFLIVSLTILLINIVIAFFKNTKHMIQRISVYIVIIVMTVSLTITFRLTGEFSKVMREQILAQMENLAYSVANTIRPSTLDSIDSAADFASPEYREMISSMESIIDPSLDVNRNIYCDIFKYDEKHGAYACAYLDQAIGTFFPLTEGETKEIKEIYETGQTVHSSKDDTSASYTYVSVPVLRDNGKVCGVVSVMTENFMLTDKINSMKKSVLLGIVVTLIFVWLLIGELISYILAKSQAQLEMEKNAAEGVVKEKVFPHYYIRIMVFVLFAAYNMTTTFLPMVITKGALESLGQGGEGLAAALPISVNLFIIGLMALFCEKLISRIGCKKIIIIGASLSAISNLIVFVFPLSYFLLFFALVIDGIGVGLTTNSMYLMVSQIENPRNRTSGYAAYNAAQISGINFGMLFGAALASSIGRRMIFPLVTAMWILSAVIFVFLWKSLGFANSSKKESSEAKEVRNSPKRILKFLTRRRIWSFILLVQVPFALMGSFIYYYLPIYSDLSGMSEILVAVLMMLYSMFAIYLGNGLTKFIMEKTGPFNLYAAIILCAAAILIYALMGNFSGLLIAIFILGLANGFGRSVQQSNFSMLDECGNFGIPDAMGIFNFTDFIGQSFGPAVMALIFLSKQVFASALVFAIVLGAFCIIHVIINSTSKRTFGGN